MGFTLFNLISLKQTAYVTKLFIGESTRLVLDLLDTEAQLFADVLKKLAIFTGKHLWRSAFFNKIAGLRSHNFFRRDSNTGVFL